MRLYETKGAHSITRFFLILVQFDFQINIHQVTTEVNCDSSTSDGARAGF